MSVHSLTTAPIDVYSKTYWTGFILAVNKEAAYELGLQDQINPAAVQEAASRGWRAERFSPNILYHTNIDSSSRTTHEHHHHHVDSFPARPPTEAERKAKKKEEEENSLNKYKWIGTGISGIGGFLSAYLWKGYQRSKETYDHTHQVQIGLSVNLRNDLTPLKPVLDKIVAIKLKVDEIRFKTLYRYFFAAAGVLVGGGLLAAGGFAKESRFITLGGLVLAVSAVWAAISAGFHWQDRTDIRNLYEKIALDPERLADTALWNLQYYLEGMTLNRRVTAEGPQYDAPSAPPLYEPFFNNQDQSELNCSRPNFGPGGYGRDAEHLVANPYQYE